MEFAILILFIATFPRIFAFFVACVIVKEFWS